MEKVIKHKNKKWIERLLKSQRGGISGIIFEIILSVMALTLLIMAIYVFRGNMDIIGNSAAKTNVLAKVKQESLIPINKNIVSGSDVVSVVRYYADEENVDVCVVMGPDQSVSYESRGCSFDIADYLTFGCSGMGEFREIPFEAAYEYRGTELVRVTYVKK
ncbi:MAG: hypothetical protein N3I35_11595 [Clostridia bacterium]|nr:hypothetical protein [Clostridia bacterium]